MENKSLTILNENLAPTLATAMLKLETLPETTGVLADTISGSGVYFSELLDVVISAQAALNGLVIIDQDGLDIAGAAVKAVNKNIGIVNDKRAEVVAPIKAAASSLSRSFDDILVVLDNIKAVAKNKIKAFSEAEAIRIRQEILKRDAEAKAKALDDRRKILTAALDNAIGEKISGGGSLSAAITRLVEGALHDNRIDHTSESGLLYFIEQSKASLKRSAKKDGLSIDVKADMASASEILAEQQSVPTPAAPIPQIIIPKVNLRKNYKFKYADKNGNHIQSPDFTLIPNEYLQVNEQALGVVARDTKGTAIIPGIIFYAE